MKTMIKMNTRTKDIVFFAARVMIYASLMILLNAVYIYDAYHVTSTGKFGEISGTEILQEIILFLSGAIFLFSGFKERELVPMYRLISLFFFMSFIREFNNQLDYWFYLVIPLLVLFFWTAWNERKKLLPSLHAFIKKPVIAWFVIGFLVTFVFSRLFGRSELWQAILENNYNRWVKNAAEEGVELLGYTLLLIGGIEILTSILKNRNEDTK